MRRSPPDLDCPSISASLHPVDTEEVVDDHESGCELVPWKATDTAAGVALVVAGVFVILVFLKPLSQAAGVDGEAPLTPWVAGLVEGLMLVAVWIFGIRKYRTSWGQAGLRVPRRRHNFPLAFLALGGSLGFTLLYVIAVSRFGIDFLVPQPIPEGLLGQGLSRALNMLVITVWGPFTEELFFRGFLLAALIPTLGGTRAAILSSAVFAAGHLMLSAALPIFITGMLLSWLYIRSRSIWPSVTAHAAQNFVVVVSAIAAA